MFLRTKILGSTRQEKYERDFEEGLVFFQVALGAALIIGKYTVKLEERLKSVEWRGIKWKKHNEKCKENIVQISGTWE